ncbi:MAG: OmpA family protein [Bacteroidota bacterium]
MIVGWDRNFVVVPGLNGMWSMVRHGKAGGMALAAFLCLAGCSSLSPVDSIAPPAPTAPAVQSPAVAPAASVSRAAPLAAPEREADQLPRPVAGSTEPLAPVRRAARLQVEFTFGATTLSEEGRELLRREAQTLLVHPKRSLILVAYPEDFGSRTYAVAIMEERLDVVAEALYEQGVAKNRIRKRLFGQRRASGACAAPPCPERGRRVEVLEKD